MIAPLVGGLWLGQQQWNGQEVLTNSWQLAAGVATRLAVSFYVPKAGVLDGFEVHSRATTTPQDLKCSFQDPDASDNPDGVVDQFVVIPLASIPATGWLASGMITSDGTLTGTPRTVSFGQRLTAVIEWDATVGNVKLDWFTQHNDVWVASNVQSFNASWSRFISRTPVFALRYSDGTYEIPVGCWPLIGPTGAGQTLTSATTPDEIGLKFTVPWDCTLTAMTWSGAIFNRAADYDVVLYSATDVVLDTTFQDASWVVILSSEAKYWHPFVTAPTLTADTIYRVTVKPRTTNTLRMTAPSFNTSALRAAVQSQDTWQWTERTNGGAWTDRPTQRAPVELQIASADAEALGADCLPIPVVVCLGYPTILPGPGGGTEPRSTPGDPPGGSPPSAIGCLDSHTVPPWNGGPPGPPGIPGNPTTLPVPPSTCP